MTNPFTKASKKHAEAAKLLALAVRTAHESDHVWASCRSFRALTGVDVSSLLYGFHFDPYVEACGEIEGLEALKSYADDYLETL